MSVKDYLEINKRAYNLLADEYHSRRYTRAYVLDATMSVFVSNLRSRFGNREVRVLDIGCGVGKSAYFLSRSGFRVTGIDYAEKAIEFARERVKNSVFINCEFMQWDTKEKFHGIVAGAFLHLFPKRTLPKVFAKFDRLLLGGGVLYINFSLEKEGLIVKEDFSNKISRYRNGMSVEFALKELSRYFDVIEVTTNLDCTSRNKAKIWYNITMKKMLK